METNVENLASLLEAFNKSMNGVSFVSIRGYNSAKSENTEVANYRVNIGVSYGNAKEKDIQTCKNMTDEKLQSLVSDSISLELLREANAALLEAFINPNENRSKGQTDSKIKMTPNGTVNYIPETGNINIFAKVVEKTVVVEGAYKATKSAPLTIAKNKIRKAFFETAKFHSFTISLILDKVKANGEEVTFGAE